MGLRFLYHMSDFRLQPCPGTIAITTLLEFCSWLNIMVGKEVINREINGKSLIMQLFREHEIPVPLKTQGWIINSLHSIRYDPQIGEWNYRYFKGSRNSTKMFDLLSKLSAAIQTRQQFEEHGASPPDSPVLDCEEEQDMEL